jgi:primosomal protein N' (replication factor Y)
MASPACGTLYAQVLLTRRRGDEALCLTYAAPAGADAEHLVGAYVLVPLGSGVATGYVVGVSDEPPEGDFAVKPIREVLPASAGLSPGLVDLGRWIADEFAAPLPECLQAMIPAGSQEAVASAFELVSRPARDQPSLFGDALPRYGDDHPVVALLAGADAPLTLEDLRAVIGPNLTEAAMEPLISAGSVRRVHVVVPARVSRKSLLALARSGSPAEARAALEQVPARAHAQIALLKQLAARAEPIPLIDIANKRAAAKALIDRAMARIVRIPVLRRPADAAVGGSAPGVVHTPAQRAAIAAIRDAIDAREGGSFVLHGVTGSGKTEVYLSAIAHALASGGRAIVLVPEISLTPQTVGRFRARFGERVAVLHSALGAGERLDEWTRARDGDADIVIGARSAIFAPVTDLRLIVMDEEHEHSYKQGSAPRYHARDVALQRGRREDAVVVLGSATPSLESYYRALGGGHGLLELPERVVGGDLPPVEVVDMRDEPWARRTALVSSRLSEMLTETLTRGEQAILLLNRRGWAPFLLCHSCGNVIGCEHCDISLTYHQREARLRCHHCGFETDCPTACPECGDRHLQAMGTGTERAEQELRELAPTARVLRLDRDTTREKGAHGRLLARFERGEADVILGTQMIAKGLDFPRVTLVGILSADTALHFPDFRAAEQTFTLLAQVAGRAGRGELGGRVLLQTFAPDHWAVQLAAKHDYAGFFAREVESRRKHGWPPFRRLANVVACDAEPFVAEAAAEAVAAAARNGLPAGAEVLGPAPCPIQRLRGQSRVHVELIAPDAELSPWVREAVSDLPAEHRRALSVDIDALSLL